MLDLGTPLQPGSFDVGLGRPKGRDRLGADEQGALTPSSPGTWRERRAVLEDGRRCRVTQRRLGPRGSHERCARSPLCQRRTRPAPGGNVARLRRPLPARAVALAARCDPAAASRLRAAAGWCSRAELAQFRDASATPGGKGVRVPRLPSPRGGRWGRATLGSGPARSGPSQRDPANEPDMPGARARSPMPAAGLRCRRRHSRDRHASARLAAGPSRCGPPRPDQDQPTLPALTGS